MIPSWGDEVHSHSHGCGRKIGVSFYSGLATGHIPLATEVVTQDIQVFGSRVLGREQTGMRGPLSEHLHCSEPNAHSCSFRYRITLEQTGPPCASDLQLTSMWHKRLAPCFKLGPIQWYNLCPPELHWLKLVFRQDHTLALSSSLALFCFSRSLFPESAPPPQ